jgi:hypothetical protein
LNRVERNFNVGIAVVVLAILGLTLVSISPLYIPSDSQLLEENCQGKKSFYLPSALYSSEQKQYSANARAYTLLTTRHDRFRIIVDYDASGTQDGNRKIVYKIVLLNLSSKPLNLNDLQAKLTHSDGSETLLFDKGNQIIARPNQPVLVSEEKIIPSDYKNDSWQTDLLILRSSGSCQGEIPNIVKINFNEVKAAIDAEKSRFAIVKTDETGSFVIPPGLSPIGFSDWRNLNPFTQAGLTIFSYDSGQKSWEINPQSNSQIMEPGKGYFVYNPKGKSVTVDAGVPFWVPQDVVSHTISAGWNLLYNDTGGEANLDEIQVAVFPPGEKTRIFDVEKVALGQLIREKLAWEKVVVLVQKTADNPNGFEEISAQDINSGKKFIPDGAVFWFYLFASPTNTEMTVPNLTLQVTGGGETYQVGDLVSLNFKLINNDTVSHFVDAAGTKDPCQSGLVVFDTGGNEIYSDLDKRSCPLWPKVVELPAGQNLEYNYIWKVPNSVHGELRLRGYFDYSRLNSPDQLFQEVKINVRPVK